MKKEIRNAGMAMVPLRALVCLMGMGGCMRVIGEDKLPNGLLFPWVGGFGNISRPLYSTTVAALSLGIFNRSARSYIPACTLHEYHRKFLRTVGRFQQIEHPGIKVCAAAVLC